MKHELKIIPTYFDDVQNGIKNFEVRYNDRDYKVGDTLLLKEWDVENFRYTGREYETSIIYVFDEPAYIRQNYVILGLSVPCNNIDGKRCGNFVLREMMRDEKFMENYVKKIEVEE